MAKFHVTCTLPNASNLISGVAFVAHETIAGAVRTAEAVEKGVADIFKGISGYTIEAVEKPSSVSKSGGKTDSGKTGQAAPAPQAPPQGNGSEQNNDGNKQGSDGAAGSAENKEPAGAQATLV